jgi:hypothetical protein
MSCLASENFGVVINAGLMTSAGTKLVYSFIQYSAHKPRNEYISDCKRISLYGQLMAGYVLMSSAKSRDLDRLIRFLVSWGCVRLWPLGTSATIWPIVVASDD